MNTALASPRPILEREPDLLSLSALALAKAIREGALSSTEVVAFYLRRIERLNPQLQAFVSVYAEWALAEARLKDRRRPTSDLPPFYGVPIAVKDLNLVRGGFARMGSRSWRWLLSPVDDLTVTALRKAGFVLLGKLSTSELALMPIVETELHGPTRNPWNLNHTAGGSSGGAGAAVAGGLLPIAQGSDGAGSIRIPAAFGHLFGFKASRGRIPNPHLWIDRFALSTIGPLARTVEDGAALLDVLRGISPFAKDSFLQATKTPPRRLKVRVVTESPLGPTDPEIVRAVLRVAETLAGLGHQVEEIAPLRGSVDEFLPIYQRQAAISPVLFESHLQPVTRWLRTEGRRVTHADALRAFHAMGDRVLRWFGDTEVLLTPTTPIPSPRVGEWDGLPAEETFRAAAHLGAFTAACNVTGNPAASVPAGFTTKGLPIGVQLVGRMGDDETILALSRELEGAVATT
jgi:amidase